MNYVTPLKNQTGTNPAIARYNTLTPGFKLNAFTTTNERSSSANASYI